MAKKTLNTTAPFTTETEASPSLAERVATAVTSGAARGVRLVRSLGGASVEAARIDTPHGTFFDAPEVQRFLLVAAYMQGLRELADDLINMRTTRKGLADGLRSLLGVPGLSEAIPSMHGRATALADLFATDGPIPTVGGNQFGAFPSVLHALLFEMEFSGRLPSGLLANAERAPDRYTVSSGHVAHPDSNRRARRREF